MDEWEQVRRADNSLADEVHNYMVQQYDPQSNEEANALVENLLEAAVAPLRTNTPLRASPINSMTHYARYNEPENFSRFADTLQRFFKYHEGSTDHSDMAKLYRYLVNTVSPGGRSYWTNFQMAQILAGARIHHAEHGKDLPYNYISGQMRLAHDNDIDYGPITKFMESSMVHPTTRHRAAFTIQRASIEQQYKPGGAGYQRAKAHFGGLLEKQNTKRARK